MIRQLESDDSGVYYNIRLKSLQLHPEAFGSGAEAWAKATDESIKTFLAKSNQDDFVLGHFQNNELTGVIALKREKKHSVGHKGTIWGFFVLPNFRNQGVGKSLLNALIQKSSKNPELEYLRAVVTISSLNVAQLFENYGFKSYGIEQRGIKQESQFFDQSFLALNLRK
jgi:ribosomal protein S18 acetylase RimI-like enzyme